MDHLLRSDEAVRDAIASLSPDPARPASHYTPAANWMDDPNGPFFDEAGTLHMFHQFNPYSDGWGHMHWAHATSADLVHWERQPIALGPMEELGEAHCYSGCTGRDRNGEPVILYTSVMQDGAYAQRLARATDATRLRWAQEREPVLTAQAVPDPPGVDPKWRDPFVFQAEGRTLMILGSATASAAQVLLFESPDGSAERWDYRGVLWETDREDMDFPECPNLTPLGRDRWALLLSPSRAVEAIVGRFDAAAGTFEPISQRVLDHRDHWYAPNTVIDPNGRALIWGWIRGWSGNRGWNGCLSLPRTLWEDEAGILRQSLAQEVASLHEPVQTHREREGAASAELSCGRFDLELQTPEAKAEIELIQQLPDGAGELEIVLQADGHRVTLGDVTIPCEEPVQSLRWVCDHGVSELMVNHAEALTQVTGLTEAPARLAIRRRGDSELTLNQLASIW